MVEDFSDLDEYLRELEEKHKRLNYQGDYSVPAPVVEQEDFLTEGITSDVAERAQALRNLREASMSREERLTQLRKILGEN